MNLFLYFNPQSGGYSQAEIARIQEAVLSRFHHVTLISDLKQLEALQGAHIIAAGGDGTIHRVINHCNIENNSFSFLPLGSGNDFYRNFGKKKLEEILQAIQEGRKQYCDVLQVNEHLAINVAGVGFEALVAQKAVKSKILPKTLKYLLPVLVHIWLYKGVLANIQCGEWKYTGKVYLASCGNGKWAGGGFKLFPNGKTNDGKLDFLLIKPLNIFQKLQYMIWVLLGKHTTLKNAYYAQSDAVKIEFTEGLGLYDADGEVYTSENVVIKINKGGICVFQ